MVSEEPPYVPMLASLGSWGVAATFIYTFTFFVPPVGMIIGGLLMITPATDVIRLNDLLKSGTIYELPSWVNECLRED